MLQGLLDNVIAVFDGDPGVRKVADDPVLSAELLLLFRMILADGAVSESEMAVFRRICREAFSASPRTASTASSNISTSSATRPTASQAIAMFRDLDRRPARRAGPAYGRHRQGRLRSWSDEEMRMLKRTSKCCS